MDMKKFDTNDSLVTSTSHNEGNTFPYISNRDANFSSEFIEESHSPSSTSRKKFQALVGNLTWWTTDQNIQDAMKEIGISDFVEVKFFENRTNGQSKGYCLITVGSECSLKNVFEKLSKIIIYGQHIIVSAATMHAKSLFESQQAIALQKDAPASSSEFLNDKTLNNLNFANTNAANSPRKNNFMQQQSREQNLSNEYKMPHHLYHQRFMGIRPMGYGQQHEPLMHSRLPPPMIPNQCFYRGKLSNNEYRAPSNQPPAPIIGGFQKSDWHCYPPPRNMLGLQQNYSLSQMQSPQSQMLPTCSKIIRSECQDYPFLEGIKAQPSVPVISQINACTTSTRPPHDLNHIRSSENTSRQYSERKTLSEEEFNEVMTLNKTVSSSAIARSLEDSSKGEYSCAIETLATAISLISKSKVAYDDRCKIIINDLRDTLDGITKKKYKVLLSSEKKIQSYEHRDREFREYRHHSRRSRKHDPDELDNMRERSRSRSRDYKRREEMY